MERRPKQYETNWCVYMHENRVNGKKYIGITSQKPTKRWKNGGGYQSNPRFYNAIQKYGWDAFRHDILFTDLAQDEAEQLEVELIAKYGTQDPAKGYNLAGGGGGCVGYKLTDEQRKKQSAALRGRTLTKEHRQRIKENHADVSGVNHPNYGKRLGEATRRKISANHADVSRTNHPKARAVRCVETGKVYGCIMDAAEAIGRRHGAIGAALRNPDRTAGGYHWRYAEVVSQNA